VTLICSVKETTGFSTCSRTVKEPTTPKKLSLYGRFSPLKKVKFFKPFLTAAFKNKEETSQP